MRQNWDGKYHKLLGNEWTLISSDLKETKLRLQTGLITYMHKASEEARLKYQLPSQTSFHSNWIRSNRIRNTEMVAVWSTTFVKIKNAPTALFSSAQLASRN